MGFDRRSLLAGGAAAWALAAAGRAHAQAQAQAQATAQRRFAVVSEIAREVTIVTQQPATGGRQDNNLRRKAPVQDGAFERLALARTREAIVRAVPGAEVFVVAPLGEDLFPALSRTTPGEDAAIPTDLKQALAQDRSQQLVVWTRLKGDPRIRSGDSADLGSGQLEGIGLYVDRFRELTHADGRGSVGFVAPYMHARATLVDVASGKVLRQRRVEGGLPYTPLQSARTGVGFDEAFTTDERVQLLAEYLRRQIDAVVPELLAAA
jgi:hypothetical protein